jgi:hypothetical protein
MIRASNFIWKLFQEKEMDVVWQTLHIEMMYPRA